MKKLFIFFIFLIIFVPQFTYASMLNNLEPFVDLGDIDEDKFYISKSIDKETIIITLQEKNTEYKYSWEFNKSKIKDKIKINFNINFESEKSEIIDSIAGSGQKKYLSFSHHGKLPEDTKVKVDVSDKFRDGDKLYLYYYNEDINKIQFIEKNIIVDNGYAEIDIDHCSEYFLTDAIVNDADNNPRALNKVIFILTFVVISLMAYTIFKKQ